MLRFESRPIPDNRFGSLTGGSQDWLKKTQSEIYAPLPRNMAFGPGTMQVGRREPVSLAMNRERLLKEIGEVREPGDIARGLRSIADYVGASTYLLARWDAYSRDSLDFAISADWPFDLVRSLGATLVRGQLRKTEIDRCLEAMQPVFVQCPPTVKLPPHLTRRLCLLPFDIGSARLLLILGFGRDMVLSDIRLEDVGFACAYYLQNFEDQILAAPSQHDLTQREVDCLNWIAEGKTSEEISVIIGISRNTVNNYITSIMNKMTTKTRSEAIAFAIRNNVI